MKLLLLGYFFCLIYSVICDSTSRVIELTDDETTVNWSPTTNESVTVQAEEGYKIQVNLSKAVNLDSENGDCVTIKNAIDDDEATEENEMLFIYTLSSNPSYFFYNNKLLANYIGTNELNTFTAKFTRVGEAMTTTSAKPTTTTEQLPTPKEEEKTNITVYLYGYRAESFGIQSSALVKLKQAITNMAKEYCSVQNAPVNGSITTNNVNVQNLEQCSILWDKYETCISLTFSVPVNINENNENDLWEGYQLNERHLRIMWNSYASKYLAQIDMSLYSEPNINGIFKNRIILASLVIVVIVVLLLILRYYSGKYEKIRRRKFSDAVSIMDQSSNRNSRLSLTPHYLQELPPLFSTDFPMSTNE